jgi:alkylation response protein AidB-like acyl-CoA dehydrogenase
MSDLITSPEDESLDRLCEQLSEWSARWQGVADWPADALQACAQAGVYRWFLEQEYGGFGWSPEQQTRGYLRLSAADLTTTFIITQFIGAVRRIASSENKSVGKAWLERMAAGEAFTTVGISHLTTSGRHLAKPVLTAVETEHGFQLNGLSPWVTGGIHADLLVIGATLADGRQILAAVPRSLSGIQAGKGAPLVALSASCTDRVTFDRVLIDRSMLLAGPLQEVLNTGQGNGAGGLQTSTLAVGLSRAAIDFLADEASRRSDLLPAANELTRELDELQQLLLQGASGATDCDPGDVRGKVHKPL